MVRTIFPLDHQHRDSPRSLGGLLGAKGADLAEMTSVLSLPVPPGFTLSTRSCRQTLAAGKLSSQLREELEASLQGLSVRCQATLGGPDPLLLSVRAGAALPMPGAMETVLNIGLNDKTTQALAEATGDWRFASDSYRRLIQMYGHLVLGVPMEAFEQCLARARADSGVLKDGELTSDALGFVVQSFLEIVEGEGSAPFPQDPRQQLEGSILAAFQRWNDPISHAYRSRERIHHDLGTAVTVQRMVFGNRDSRSGSGLACSHDPRTGAAGLFVQFVTGGQGEDVTAGNAQVRSLAELEAELPDAMAALGRSVNLLEAEYRDMMSVEFTVERGEFWLLQAQVADRSGVAAVRAAVEGTRRPTNPLSVHEAVLRVSGDHLDQILHPQFEQSQAEVLAAGLGASPGAAVGRVYFSADDALDAYDEGEDVILVKDETSPEDVPGMSIAEGILTTKGGLASHAAVVARGWGKPAVCGASDIIVGDGFFKVGETRVNQGDLISIDGGAGTVFVGEIGTAQSEPNTDMTQILAWADEIREGKLEVRANADTADDALVAREFGAEGIGLCRTEHQFLGERLPLVQAMILATSEEEESAALSALAEVQQRDFLDLLQAMDGLPVTIRLLDPPLHEFLPKIEELSLAESSGTLSEREQALLSAAREWSESNPMLGTRGVRLGILRPGLFRMQAKAIMAAGLEHRSAGGHPRIEIMVPLIINRPELDLVRSWIEAEVATANELADEPLDVRIGSMVETPRAALCAEAIAPGADFFSFGTNDLTQMTLGFSRDDVESRIVGEYVDRSLLGANPFQTLDVLGVGALMRRASEAARAANPGIKLGICGEHGGDPASIGFFWECGLDYVSCSPYRVPIARLAAAQAVLGGLSQPDPR